MRYRLIVLSGFISLGLLLGWVRGTLAQVAHDEVPVSQPSEFQPIEQPLWAKAFVTGGGLSLLSLEIWWFLFSQPKMSRAKTSEEGRETIDPKEPL